MKLSLFIFLFPILSFSQHTERFKELTKDVKKDMTKMDTLYFGNGNIEYTIEIVGYVHNGEEVKTQTGKTVLYYKSGIVAREDLQDDFGNWLTSKYYNRSGVLTEEWITTEIDTRAKNLDEFFKSVYHIDFKRIIKHYRFSKKTNELYPYKIEYLTLINNIYGRKVEFLYENGQIRRMKKLKEKARKNVW